MMLVVTILLSNFVLWANGQENTRACPSDQYVWCANQGDKCDIPSNIKEGYMSYGRNGRWILSPFTNTGSNDIRIECDDDNGDPIRNTKKRCCYLEAGIGFDGEFSNQIRQGKWYKDLDGSYGSIRFGEDSQYFHRVFDGNAFGGDMCNKWFFNRHQIGTTKHCELWKGKPASIPDRDATTWESCGNEWSTCKGLDKGAAQWVRFGREDSKGAYYTFRLVISAADGEIPCDKWMFENPTLNTGAKGKNYCSRAPAEYTFTNLVGKWEPVFSCSANCQKSWETGVEITEGVTLTETLSTSLSQSISSGFEFMGEGVDYDVTLEMSHSVSKEMQSSITKSISNTFAIECADATYQWVTGSKMNNGVDIYDLGVKSDTFLCIEGNYPPRCPPLHCADKNKCQACSWESVRDYDFKDWHAHTQTVNGFKILLGACQGHCQTDADCLSGLKCYLQSADPPGCVGTKETGANYCGNFGFADTSSAGSMPLYTKPVPHAPGNPQSPVVVNPQVPVSVNPEAPVSVFYWSFKDWYHAHYYELGLFLASLLVVLCMVNLCVMMKLSRRKVKLYAPVNYMESDMESDVEVKPIKI